MKTYRAKRERIRKRNRRIVSGVMLLSALSIVWVLGSRLFASPPSDFLKGATGMEAEAGVEENTENKTLVSAKIEQTNLTGLTIKEAEETIEERYQWGLAVSDGSEVVSLDNLLSGQLKEIQTQLTQTPPDQVQKYTIDRLVLKEPLKKQVAELAKRWDQPEKNSQLDSFDPDTGVYHYTKEQYGRVLNQEKLIAQVMNAVKEEDLQREISAEFTKLPPKRTKTQAKEQYQVIGTFSTTTTNNKNRNKNISLAVDAMNGLIVKPGEEFSFNHVTGNRTKDKGYQPAGAYRNGVLIEEPGGGVCQVSTTLYHAVIEGGFKTTERNSHSFAPSYVKKGQDAMVSFDGYAGPDLKFINTSQDNIVVRAALKGNKLNLSLVGIPLLDQGQKVEIVSKKVRDADPLPPVYEENPALLYGTEKVIHKGSTGSVYKSYRITRKGDTIIKEEPLHNSSYKGKPAIIQRNTTVMPEETVPETVPETESETETETETTEAEQIGPGI
ncbi:VanW family protein [Clostridium sp. E02]|uniref:VanW family protein n=1 Tax=Clostridium sp. E02 TaxID=2487134 RepID=UPI000F54963C|nr:VanW family protein [Clostridium sp. E02]